VFEIKKRSNVYDKKEKAISNYAGFDVIRDNKYYFVIAKVDSWSDQVSKNIILDIIKNYVIKYNEDEVNNFITKIGVIEKINPQFNF
jgi:hypothetical protein